MKYHHCCKKNSQKGFTLIELLVAMGIFAIVIAIATGGFINSLRTQRQVASLISAQSNASLVLEQMAREIRTGFLFCHDEGNNGGLATTLPMITRATPVLFPGASSWIRVTKKASSPRPTPFQITIFPCGTARRLIT